MTYDEFKETYNIYGDVLTSCGWALGGSWGDCWGNSGSITPEPQPTSFEEFDRLIEKINKDISFMQYKNLYNSCVSTESKSEGDWYGGTAYYGYFQCDIRKLYAELNDRDLI
jgi:hypothetical protein